MDTRDKTWRTRAAAAGLLALSAGWVLAGCGSFIQPGAYKIYKVDAQAASMDSGCFFDKPDPNTASDSDSWLSSETWILTVDTSDNYFLDLGNATLLGRKTDSGYAFEGKKVDVEFENDDPTQTKTTSTVDTQISFTVSGKSLGGTSTVTTTIVCEGAHCLSSTPKCTVTSKFSATEVDDVELQYGVK